MLSEERAKKSVKRAGKKAVRGVGGALEGFKDFALRGNAFDLAVGVVIGGAVTALVNALVNAVINPLIAAVFGKPDMTGVWNVTIHGSVIQFGTLFSAVLNFIIIAAGLYFFFILPLNKLMSLTSKKEEPAEEELEEDQPKDEYEKLLREIRDILHSEKKVKYIKK
jgi:large conductance mechanosensitive channel